MVEYRILREREENSKKDARNELMYGDVDVSVPPVSEHDKNETIIRDEQKTKQNERYDRYAELGGSRQTLSIGEAKHRSILDVNELDQEIHLQSKLEQQPWQAIEEALSHALAENDKDNRRDEDKTLSRDNSVLEPERENDDKSTTFDRHADIRAEDVEVSQDEKSRATFEEISKTTVEVDLATQAEFLKFIEPWRAIADSPFEQPSYLTEPDHTVENTKERLESHAHDIEQGLDIEGPDNRFLEQSLEYNVPTDVAHALVAFEHLEPETVDYLTEKYGCSDKHLKIHDADQILENVVDKTSVERDQENQHEPSLSSAEPVERTLEAQIQIEEIERVDAELVSSPRLTDYTTLTVRAQDDSHHFEIVDARAADRDELEHVAGVQTILDQRTVSPEPEVLQEIAEERSPLLPDKSRDVIVRIQRDLSRQEQELDRLDDAEPPPSNFCTIRISESSVGVIRYWDARTLEEFDYYDPSIPASPGAIREIVGKDREYKRWLARREHAREELRHTRQLETDRGSGGSVQDYDMDYER